MFAKLAAHNFYCAGQANDVKVAVLNALGTCKLNSFLTDLFISEQK